MRVLLIGNPASGGGRGTKRMELVERHLRAAGCRVDARLSQYPGHATELLAAPPLDTDRVIACGGDGLVSQVASALAGRDLPLAIVQKQTGADDLTLGGSVADLDTTGGGFCFFDNDSDGDAAALASLPPGATSTGVAR